MSKHYHVVFDCDGTIVDTSQFKYGLFEGIKELLTELSQDCYLYVWTARDRLSTLRILKELQVHQYFTEFSTCDDAPPKPHIGGLVDLVGGVPKHSICVIGDTSNDIYGARNFGVMSIGAAWNTEVRPGLLSEVGANFIVSHPSECSKIIQQNLKGEEHA